MPVERAVDKPVDKPVDKHCFLGRTAHVLWMNCGWLKNLEMRVRNPLCGPHRRRRTALTTGDGYRPGGDRGDVGRVGKPALAAGIRDRRQVRECQAAEQSVRGAAGPGEAPPSHTWRGLLPFCPKSILPTGTDTRRTAASRPRRARAKCRSPSQIPGDPVAYTNPAIRLLHNQAGRCWLMPPLTRIGVSWYR